MALRALTRRKGVTALAILSLGLAIGFCTAGFSLVDAFAWRDLPVREPRRLTRVNVRDREQRLEVLSWIEYQALASRPRFWEGLVAECRMGPKVRLADRDDFPITAGVSENYFDLLGVKPALGEIFHAGTGRDGAVVLSNHYWRTALGGDVHIVGRTLSVGNAVLTITGVLPAGFTGTNRGALVELFVPPKTFFGSLDFKDHLDQHLADFEVVGMGMHTMRQHMFMARKDDVILTGIFLALALLGLLLAAAGLFGVTTYAVSRRMREFGLRVALGATSHDLRRQVLRKAALQGAIGIPLGWGLALASRHVVQSLLYGVKATDPWMLVAASGVVALVAFTAALRPAFTAARVDPVIALRYE
jgi:hypothetical protein